MSLFVSFGCQIRFSKPCLNTMRRSLFWKQEMELAIIGLQNAGKSTFVQVITHGEFVEGAKIASVRSAVGAMRRLTSSRHFAQT